MNHKISKTSLATWAGSFPFVLCPVNRWVSPRLHFLISNTLLLRREDGLEWTRRFPKIQTHGQQCLKPTSSTGTACSRGEISKTASTGLLLTNSCCHPKDLGCPGHFGRTPCHLWRGSWKPPGTETLDTHASPNKSSSRCLSLETFGDTPDPDWDSQAALLFT